MGLFDDAVAEASTLLKSKRKPVQSDVAQDLSPLQEGNRAIATMPKEEPGVVPAVAKQLYAGAIYDLPSQMQGAVASAGRLMQEAGVAPELGKKIEQAGVEGKQAVEAMSQADESTRPVIDPEKRPIASAFEQGARSVAPSIVTMPLYAVSPALGAAATVATFGGQASQDTYENVKKSLTKQGVSPEEAHRRATIAGYESGAAQGGGEVLGDLFMNKLFTAGGRISHAVLNGAAKAARGGEDVLKEIANPKLLKEFGKNLAETVASESLTEGAQDYATRAIEQEQGVQGGTPGEAFKQAVGPAAAMTLLMAPIGAAGHYAAHKQIQSLRNTLSDPAKSMAARAAATEAVAEQLDQVDPEQAKNWRQNAAFSIDRDLPITLDPSSLRPVIEKIRANGPDFTLQGKPYDQNDGSTPITPREQPLPPAPSSENLPVVAPESRPAAPIADGRVDASYGPGDANYKIYGLPPELGSNLPVPAAPRGPISRAAQSLLPAFQQPHLLTGPSPATGQSEPVPPTSLSLRPDLMPSEGNTIPAHIERAITEPRTVPVAVAVKTKQLSKETIAENMANGTIPEGSPIRMTDVGEISNIIKNGSLTEGTDFEGRIGISAQTVGKKTPIIGYGGQKISAFMVFRTDHVEGNGTQPNEVKIDPKTPLKDILFGIDGYRNLMTADELSKIVNPSNLKQEAKNAETIRSDEGQVRKGSKEGQPEVQRSAVEGGGNLQQPASEKPGNGKEEGIAISGENAENVVAQDTVKKIQAITENTDRLLKEGGYMVAIQPKSEKGEANLHKKGYRPYTWDDATNALKEHGSGVWAKKPAEKKPSRITRKKTEIAPTPDGGVKAVTTLEEKSVEVTPATVVPKNIKPETITINDIPSELEVTVTAIREKTGRKFRIKENAREAFARIQADMDSFQEVLKCLGT